MNYVTIYTATTITPPFSGTACDFFGNNCSYIGSGTTFPVTFYLPSQFNTAPVLQLTLTDSLGCTVTETLYCSVEGAPKQFQNLEYFFFMDGSQYYFQ
jgi:hypothetical protein